MTSSLIPSDCNRVSPYLDSSFVSCLPKIGQRQLKARDNSPVKHRTKFEADDDGCILLWCQQTRKNEFIHGLLIKTPILEQLQEPSAINLLKSHIRHKTHISRNNLSGPQLPERPCQPWSTAECVAKGEILRPTKNLTSEGAGESGDNHCRECRKPINWQDLTTHVLLNSPSQTYVLALLTGSSQLKQLVKKGVYWEN